MVGPLFEIMVIPCDQGIEYSNAAVNLKKGAAGWYTSAWKVPSTPAGSPAKVAPVAPVVDQVISVIAVLIQMVWLSVPAAEVRLMVLSGSIVIVPLAVIMPHPPIRVRV